jgi:hypothetical protein
MYREHARMSDDMLGKSSPSAGSPVGLNCISFDNTSLI